MSSQYIPTGLSGQVLTSGAAGGVAGYASLNPNGNITTSNAITGAYKISGDCDIAGDLKINGVSLKDQLDKINERLAILVPDPVLLGKYAALRELYDQYKTLEALCK